MEHCFKVDGKAKDDRQTEEPANQTESIRRRRRDWGQFCVGSPQTPAKLSYKGGTQGHSRTKCASWFQLLNTHTHQTGPSEQQLFTPATEKTRPHTADRTRRNAFVTPACAIVQRKNFISGLSPWQQELPGEPNPARPSG